MKAKDYRENPGDLLIPMSEAQRQRLFGKGSVMILIGPMPKSPKEQNDKSPEKPAGNAHPASNEGS